MVVYYDIIDNVNLLLENIDNASDAALNESLVKNIKGQAYAYRAYSYWQLVQMFAYWYDYNGSNTQLGVPLVLDNSGEAKPRFTVEALYEQIFKDIDQSMTLLAESDESRPNKSHLDLSVAQGLKARFALTTGDWATAVDMAHQARQGYPLTVITKTAGIARTIANGCGEPF